ncbi:synaptic vesicle membrane protein VAT-1 homolog isoform X1 [Metopolophium dirhodum]|uniref:synaptic vesicle membrane protein VAT-1 homolog isoform X1 n=1 Tax=Metopolophium dirhodum TaxID=44670 RepID=UPI00299059A1|nr:synaptic vesicle membrane protein VAT-1 homolog isoform X1 [Metopolophium dirhodum]
MNNVKQTEQVKSIVLEGYGGYDKIKIRCWPLEFLGSTSVCVRVQLCGVNFSDLYTRQGFLRQLKTPRVLGAECYGTIETTGNEVNNFQYGDRVVCYVWTGGLFGEKVIVPANNCFLVPESVSGQDAVALPANYLTAYLSIFTMGNIQPGDTVLIHSIAGGVGCAATQLANTVKDTVVVGTASASKHKQLKENGVSHVLHHENYETLAKNVSPEGYDLIIDSIGGPNIEISQTLLKPCGRLVIIGGSCYINGETLKIVRSLSMKWQTKNLVPQTMIEQNITVCGLHLGMLFDSNPKKIHYIMEELLKMLKNKLIKPTIHEILPFDNVIEAQTILAERMNFGKVLLKFNH